MLRWQEGKKENETGSNSPPTVLPKDQLTASNCQLCELTKLTKWYHHDDLCVVLMCKTCHVPMVVFRPHRPPSTKEINHCVAHLNTAAREVFGQDFQIDYQRKSCPAHWHCHSRPT